MQKAFFVFANHKKKIKQCVFSILLSSFIFGCATPAKRNPSVIEQQVTDQWLINRAILEKVQYFEAVGKVIFKGNKQKISANFLWQQNENNLSLRLTNFFGSTLLKIDSTTQGTTLTDHQGKTHFGKDISSLLRSLTGVEVPVNELANWLKALPNKENAYQLNTQNNLARLSQYPAPNQLQGWQLEYQTYSTFNNIALPKNIKMNNQDQEISLMINNWIL